MNGAVTRVLLLFDRPSYVGKCRQCWIQAFMQCPCLGLFRKITSVWQNLFFTNNGLWSYSGISCNRNPRSLKTPRIIKQSMCNKKDNYSHFSDEDKLKLSLILSDPGTFVFLCYCIRVVCFFLFVFLSLNQILTTIISKVWSLKCIYMSCS